RSPLFPYTTLFRSDQRAHVVEQVALVQVRVVVVDLTRPLGCVDDELVLRVDLLEKAVDGGLDDALVGSGHGRSPCDVYTDSTTSRAASPTSAFTTKWSNSGWAANSTLAVRRRRARSSAFSVPRPTSRLTSSSQLGGSRKTRVADGSAARTCRAPCRSISRSTVRPSASARSMGARG